MSEAKLKPKPQRGARDPANFGMAVATAMQAMAQGTADPEQQKLAFRWIVEQASGMYEFQYYVDPREEAFSLGRCFVGQQIVGVTKVKLSELMRKQNG